MVSRGMGDVSSLSNGSKDAQGDGKLKITKELFLTI